VERRSARRQKGATIADVARLAGVSPMTVSRVVNGESHVSEAKRDAVNAAIRALNYAPNPAARSLAAGAVVRLGLLYANPSAAYLSEFLVGCLDQCRAEHVQLVVETCATDDKVAAVQTLLASGVDGVILSPPLCDAAAVLNTLSENDALAVAVATGDRRAQMSTVRIDNFAAAKSMAEHLLELGHRRIAFIKGAPDQTDSGERLRGYLAALGQAGIAPDPALIEQGFFDFRSGLAAAGRLLDLARRPSAIFAANDDMAAAAIAAAHRRAIEVPRDLSVVGFDDSALAVNVWPELTTIRQPIAEMARRAVSVLVADIRARVQGAAVSASDLLLPHVLVRRGSDAPLAG
jgi:LacI family transcriptional regulator